MPAVVSKQSVKFNPVNFKGASSMFDRATPKAWAIDLKRAISSEEKSVPFDYI